MTFLEQVQRDAAIEAAAFRVAQLSEAMKTVNGIVFIYARWSGPAIHAWRTLTTMLATLKSLPTIIVVDADEFAPVLANELLGELPQGNGETFWIKDGKCIARLSGYRGDNEAVLLQHTKLLADK